MRKKNPKLRIDPAEVIEWFAALEGWERIEDIRTVNAGEFIKRVTMDDHGTVRMMIGTASYMDGTRTGWKTDDNVFIIDPTDPRSTHYRRPSGKPEEAPDAATAALLKIDKMLSSDEWSVETDNALREVRKTLIENTRATD